MQDAGRLPGRPGQVAQHLVRAVGEAGQGARRADGQHPEEPGRRRAGQPQRTPSGHPPGQIQHDGQQQGQLGQQ